jgi:glyoxylate/hydroxypyruvate reductase A
MTARSTLLLIVPTKRVDMWTIPLAQMAPDLIVKVHGQDEYDPATIDYALSFRPPPGLLATLPNLRVVFSLGAGVESFLNDPDYPRHVPLTRFVDHTLSRDMAQYSVLHVLMHYRQQRHFDALQQQHKWRQNYLSRPANKMRIGILGLGEIGTVIAGHLCDLDFAMAGWSRTKKEVRGVESFTGQDQLQPFLERSDILICVLPLTPDTRHILNKETFAMLPKDAYVINIARGGHINEPDLLAALDSGHLSGAALDVFETEPLPEDSPIWGHPKIMVTPHVAAISDPRAMAKVAVDGIAAFESGRPLQNVVDFKRGY